MFPQSPSHPKLPIPEMQLSPRTSFKKDSFHMSAQRFSQKSLHDSASPKKLSSKPSMNASFKVRTIAGEKSPQNRPSNFHMREKSQTTIHASSPKQMVITDQSFHDKVQTLFDKIASEDSKLVYEPTTDIPMFKHLQEVGSDDEGRSSPRTEKNRGGSPMAMINSKTLYIDAEDEFLPTYANIRSPMADKREVSFARQTTKVIPKGSRFVEILELKQKNMELEGQNKLLKEDIKAIDEFDVVLKKKTKFENFNEKRCDILKACVNKQQRYISYLHHGLKLEKKFYKDLRHVLAYLMEMNDKYVNSKTRGDRYSPHQMQIDKKNDLAKKTLVDVYNNVENEEALQAFIQNFNEAYGAVRSNYDKNAELDKVFKMSDDIDQSPENINSALNPEANKTVKANYMLKQFLQKYETIFPMYTIFDEFELKDKNDYSEFLNQLIVTADKVDEIFKKVKNFDMLKSLKYTANEDTPGVLISNVQNFKHYFDKSNKSKRIFLDSNQILSLEKSLSVLMNELVTFHNNLAINKANISLEAILKLQENVRNNVEELLLLGITSNCDFSMNDKIIVLDNNLEHDEVQSFLNEVQTPKKELLVEVYNHEYKNLQKFDKLHAQILKTVHSSITEAKEPTSTSESFIKKIKELEHYVSILETNYQDMELISRMKDLELTFRRKFSQEAYNEVESFKKLANTKLQSADELCGVVQRGVKELTELYDAASAYVKESKFKTKFPAQFETICKKLGQNINKVLMRQVDVNNSLYKAEELFADEVIKIKNRLNNSSHLLKNTNVQIKKK